MKICKKCQKLKPLLDYYKDVSSADNLTRYCKECCKEKFKTRYHTIYKKKPRIRWDHKHILDQNNNPITIELYEQLLIDQDNKCAICSRDFTQVQSAVDHNHTTNKIRMILCRQCNCAIGLFKENTQILKNAIDYLDKFNDKNNAT